MHCPKCNTAIDDNQTVCPNCHKVLLLECPNCHNLGESSICEKCGYNILVKCSKCGKIIPTTKEKCKCGFPTFTSIAYQECESDEFASIIVTFGALKTIKRQLKSQELYTKFFFKLKNLLYAQLKGIECKLVMYENTFVINMSKELSLTTSANKAVRLALKIANAFVSLNSNIIEEFSLPLNLSLTIIKKKSENLLELTSYENNVKPLTINKKSKKYLKGLQIILDQFIRDEVNKDYKTDSLYSLEDNGISTMFYEVILDSYILPPSSEKEELSLSAIQKNITKPTSSTKKEKDIYSFKVFDINAKCSFEKSSAIDFFNKISHLDLDKNAKILAIKTTTENRVSTDKLIKFYEENGYKVITTSCTEQLTYKPWGFFETLFKEFYNISYHNKFIDTTKIDPSIIKKFQPIFDLISSKTIKAMTPEDARFTYMEYWNKFLSSLNNVTIIIDGFENLDDTSIQTLELYFDKFKKIIPNFVFITAKEHSVHSKIEGLLRTPLYTEFSLQESSIEACLETLKSDATDFIQSFYFEKVKENFKGSYLYFENAIDYLKETGVLIDFENKLLIKNKKSVILPTDLSSLYKARIKHLSKNADISFILAYTSILGPRLDIQILEALGIKDSEKNVKELEKKKNAIK